MSEYQQPDPNEEAVSLKELILSVQGYLREYLRNWKLIAAVTLLCIALLVIRALLTPAVYPAEITFMVNNDEVSGGGGTLNPILGQFLGGAQSDYNLDKILEMSKSMRITKAALFEKGTIGGEEDYYINHLIRSEEFHKKWKKDTTGLKDFLFTRRPESGFSRTENKALKKVYLTVRGNPEKKKPGLVTTTYQENTGILSMKAKTRRGPLSIAFLKEMYEKVSDFYVHESTEKQQTTYDLMKSERDSLFAELSSKEVQLARAVDSNIGLVSRSAQLKINRLERDVQLLTIAYGKALESTEVAEFALRNATPFFQVIDEPIVPLKVDEPSLELAILIGGVVGVFLGVMIVSIRKIYREAMA